MSNRPQPKGGSRKGIPNKLTVSVKEAIEAAASGLGGGTRLEAWAREAPENEKAFWTTIYPKLLPLQVTGKDGGALQVAASVSLRPPIDRAQWIKEHVDAPTRPATGGD